VPDARRRGVRAGGAMEMTAQRLAALIAVLFVAGSALAQAPGDEFGETPAPAAEPTPQRAEGEPAAEPDADPDPDPDPSVALQLALSLGPTTEEQLDEVMASLGYDRSASVFGGDLTVLLPLARWLWVGARAQLRARGWTRDDGEGAFAFGLALLAEAEARLAVSPSLQFGLYVGGGGGLISMRLNEAVDTPAAPAFVAGGRVVVRIAKGASVFGRLEYDYFLAPDFNDSGFDLSLSGMAFAVGVEVRR